MIVKWNTDQVNKLLELYNNGEISLDEYWDTITELKSI